MTILFLYGLLGIADEVAAHPNLDLGRTDGVEDDLLLSDPLHQLHDVGEVQPQAEAAAGHRNDAEGVELVVGPIPD